MKQDVFGDVIFQLYNGTHLDFKLKTHKNFSPLP